MLGAGLAKESVRDVYLTDNPAVVAVPLDKAIAGCLADEVPEVRSLGYTLKPLAFRDPRPPSDGSLERADRRAQPLREEGQTRRPWLRQFRASNRLRVLLHAGGVTWPSRPNPPRIRMNSPTQTRSASFPYQEGVLAPSTSSVGIVDERSGLGQSSAGKRVDSDEPRQT